MSLNKKFPSGFSVNIDLELINIAVYEYSNKRNCITEEYEKVENKILKIPYVAEVSFNHNSWLGADLETSSPTTAFKRLEAIQCKLEKILNWYEAKNKKNND